jgi:predicted HicB family RNase H-like nuclease
MADSSKPYASLSSGLLARKGGAKPAMRPQGFNGFNGNPVGGGFGGSLEDLGWNDMGPEDEFHSHNGPIGLTPASRHGQAPEPIHGQEPTPIHGQQPTPIQAQDHDEPAHDEPPFEEASFDEASYDEAPEQAPVEAGPVVSRRPLDPPPVVEQQRALRESFAEAEVVALPRRRASPSSHKAKAAFTLRLDPERHLKLRLASAVTRLSAQQLVTGALDDFLNSLPDLDALAERVPAEAGKRSR